MLFRGNGIAFKSLINFVKLLPYALKERRAVKMFRRKSDVEVFKPFRKAILIELIKMRNVSRLAYMVTLAAYKGCIFIN